MTDLTRRSFIKNVGFVGATTLFCGSLLGQNAFTNFSDLDKEEKNILSNFSKSNISNAFLLDQALFHCYTTAIVSWQKMGYQSSGNFCYSSDDNRLKMFPMHLHVDSAGKLDDVLLCFGKNDNGEWKSLKSLSGFDLEAITVAMEELQMHNSNVNLSHYLFPAAVTQVEPYGFMTQKGSVYLKTILSPENTAITIIIKEGTTVVYQKELISKHSLNVTSVLV
ncbi:hypothetical protein GJU43_08400 [Flavobacterium sp. LC2016-23]|uniref:hypothetical protein n=1 Tax=Flavobacterium sp. LC2016-23 TaxID=2666330 RepID=UPI0012B03317|nr:hypothetical protein [Flavobacterium sp. LC2016-23]MRX39291.1 hypothetical protein [Flavobacterium sp. LC2016-23]